MSEPIRLGVLVSGGGTTLENFVTRIKDGSLNAQISVVVSSSRNAYALVRAENHDIPSHVVFRSSFPSPSTFGEAIGRVLDVHKVDLVVMAGFLKLWTIPDRYLGRAMNIHPALIPAFCGEGMYGHHVHEAAIASGVKVSGCTVHFADNEYDSGPIILQRAVPVTFDDTPDTLAARVFKEECIAYPEAIDLYTRKRLTIIGRRVKISPP